MRKPQPDISGSVLPHDHEEILDDHRVIRCISPLHIAKTVEGRLYIASFAYQASAEPGGGMSIDIETLMAEYGLEPHQLIDGSVYIGAVRFVVGALRSRGFQVGYDPLEDDLCHGEVWGRFSNGDKKYLKMTAEWAVPIDGVDLR